MGARRDRLRQWLQGKIEASRTAEEPKYILLEELAKRVQLDIDYLYELHRESALFRLVNMPDGGRHVRREEILTLLQRSATRAGVPQSLDQGFYRPEDLAGEIGIRVEDFLDLLLRGEVGAVRIGTFLRVPEEEISRLLREMEGE